MNGLNQWRVRAHRGQLAGLLLLVGAGCSNNQEANAVTNLNAPVLGDTEFISASTGNYGSAGTGGDSAATGVPGSQLEDDTSEGQNEDEDNGNNATVERGDIFRVLPDGYVLNFNQYRGLQLLDVNDPSAPHVEGRLALAGTPLELYVTGDQAVLILSSWQGYAVAAGSSWVQPESGGLVALVDISDRSAPKLVDTLKVEGTPTTSRLVTTGSQQALYLATQTWQYPQSAAAASDVAISEPEVGLTVLRSMSVTDDALVDLSTLTIEGYTNDVQATAEVMMVARQHYDSATGWRSRVALVDISDPSGVMTLGDEVVTKGTVYSKFNMDIHGNVLRVVSGDNWDTQTNHLETFDITNLNAVVTLDSCDFGDGQQLFGTYFIDNRAFFVTYLRQDPFHAFAIDDAGQCAERNEFIVSGWNDFFQPVSGGTRLIGIGKNDQSSTTLAVSLYDITDLDNPTPLVQRAEMDIPYTDSEASWDDRAFTVLEDAVTITAPDGTTETGLVLLPFQSYGESQRMGVQLFTFSDDTLTLRGLMDSSAPVRRSFPVDATFTANLSDTSLALHDTSDPDTPSALGSVTLAANEREVFLFGDHVVRVRVPSFSDYYYYAAPTEPKLVQVLPFDADLNSGEPVAELELPYSAELVKVGNLLVALDTTATADTNELTVDAAVFDFSDPSNPQGRGNVTAVIPNQRNLYWDYEACYDCATPRIVPLVVDDALVFVELQDHTEELESWVTCVEYFYDSCSERGYGAGRGGYDGGYEEGGQTGGIATDPVDTPQEPGTGGVMAEDDAPASESPAPAARTDASAYLADNECLQWHQGRRECTIKNGTETCTGDFQRCQQDSTCEPIPAEDLPYPPNRECYDQTNYRYWTSYTLHVMDLQNPDSPTMRAPIAMPTNHGGDHIFAAGASVYYSSSVPTTVAGDARSYVKRYLHTVDLSTPAEPDISPAINVQGVVLAARGDDIYTRDWLWSDDGVVSLVARLQLEDDKRARLMAQQQLPDTQAMDVLLDPAGRLLVTHQGLFFSDTLRAEESDDPAVGSGVTQAYSEHYGLSILDGTSLEVLGRLEQEGWYTLAGTAADKVLFFVSNGLVTVDTSDPAQPTPQAYFPLQRSYWSTQHFFELDEDFMYVAGGLYGLNRLPLDAHNLSTE